MDNSTAANSLALVLRDCLAALENGERPPEAVRADLFLALAGDASHAVDQVVAQPANMFFSGIEKEARERFRMRAETGEAVFGLPTGLSRLDTVLGGFQPGLHFLAAKPGTGKTTFSLQVARSLAEHGFPTLFVSFEERAERLVLKSLCSAAGLNSKLFADGLSDTKPLREAQQRFSDIFSLTHFIQARPSTNPSDLYRVAAELFAEVPQGRCMVIVDYLQLWGRGRLKEGKLSDLLAHLTGELRDYFAALMKCPVLCISSQARAEDGQYDQALKAGGELEYDADSVMYLTPNDARTEEIGLLKPGATTRGIDLVIEKNRYGDTGTIEMVFRPEIGRFREVVGGAAKDSFFDGEKGAMRAGGAPQGLVPAYMRGDVLAGQAMREALEREAERKQQKTLFARDNRTLRPAVVPDRDKNS